MALKSLVDFKLKEELVDVPEIEEDGQILVREMNSVRSKLFQETIKADHFNLINLIIACCVDEDGAQVNDHKDSLLLESNIPKTAFANLVNACLRVNGFTTDEAKKKGK